MVVFYTFVYYSVKYVYLLLVLDYIDKWKDVLEGVCQRVGIPKEGLGWLGVFKAVCN